MDLDKLAQELGGKPVSDLDALAAELGGEVATTPGGYGATTLAKDVGKLVTSGAVKGVAGAPETVQAAGSAAARESLFAPTEALNLIADPRRLANKLVGSVGLPPIFETTKEQPLVPAQVTAKQRAAVDETLSKGKIPQLRQLTEYGNRLSEEIENTISPEMRLAMAESQPTGNIIKALETGDFSELSMGTNPTALGLTGQAVKVFGTSAPALLTALVTKSAGPATAVGFGQAGAEGIDEARNYIKNMSDEELAKKSEYFRNLITLGYSTNQARQMTEDKAADTASLAQGSVGALGGAFTAKLLQGGFDKTLLGNVKSRLGKVLQGAGIAGAEGAITEMAEGVATDLGIDKTVVREIGVDSFANLVLGAIGEAAPGVIRGAVAPGESVKGAEAPEAQPTEAPVTAVTPVAPVEGAPPAIIPEGGFEAEEVTPPTVEAPAVQAPVAEAPAVEAPVAPEVAPVEAPVTQGQERLNKFLAEDKTNLIQSIAENNNISLDYAEKVYNAEKEYREAQAKYYTPELINSPEFAAAQKKYDAFQNRLRSVIEKKKVVEPTPEEIAPTPVEAVTEPILEAPKFAVDEQGEKLRYPMFVDLADKGYQLYSFENPRTYENKGGVRYRTLEKDGVRIALEPQQLLFTDPKRPNQQPQLGMGTEKDVAFHFIGVDPELRKQGKAKQALQDLIEVADKNEFTLYGEPAQLEKEGMTVKQLTELYKRYGFKPTDKTGRVIVREPGAEMKVAPKATEVVTAPEAAEAPEAVEELPKFSKAENVPVIPEGETVDSTDPDVLKKFNEIIETYEPRSGRSQEGSFLSAIDRDLRNKKEVIDSPPFKKGYPPGAKIEVAPFNGGYVAGSQIMNDLGGYASGVSVWSKNYPTKQEAINAEIDRLRDSALTYGNKKAITWLDSIDPRATKEGKAEINRQRQAEKKAAAEAKKAKPAKAAKPVEEKKPEVKEAHVEGKKKEPITSKTIEEAIDKAETKVDAKKIKQAVKNQFDQAIKKATILTDKAWSETKGLPDEEAYVNISIPGDGKFKVKNNKERLEEFKKRLTAAIPLKEGKPRREPSAASVSAPDVAFKNMLDDNDIDAAIEYAKLKKLDLDPKAGQVKLDAEQRKKLQAYFGTKEEYDKYKREIGVAEEPKEEKPKEAPEPEKIVQEKVSPDERYQAEKHAEELGGEIVWQKGELALIRGYSVLSGKPVYAVAKGKLRTRVGVDSYTGDLITKEEKAELTEAVDKLEKAAQAKHETDPFIKFQDGIALSKDISPELAGVIKEWKKLLGLKPNIYITTVEDAKANRNNFTGPHRSIGSSTLSTEEAGTMRKMPDFSYYITFEKSTSKTKMLEVIAHELGHVHEREVFLLQPDEMKVKIRDEFEKWLTSQKDKSARELVNSMRAKTAAKTTVVPSGMKAEKMSPYWKSFGEWYADQVSRWATTTDKPLTTVEKFFKRLGNQMRRFYGLLKNAGYLPNETFKQYLDKIADNQTMPPERGEDGDFAPESMAKKVEPPTDDDVDILLEKHKRPRPPIHPSQPVKDAFMGGFDKAKNTVKNIQQEPLMATNNMIGKVDRAITQQRNKNIFYGTGLELADRQRYGGQVRNAHKQAIASVALVNAIHSGHIATQVMTQGKLIFNQDTQMFQAAKSDKSMANVVRAKAKLVEKLGDVRAAKVIQAFFEAKRSRSIINEYLDRTAAYEAAIDSGESVADASRDLKNIEIAMQKIQMTDEAIDDFIKLDEKYPELKEMMDNWTAVNQNMIDMMEFSGLISKQRAKTLRGIKDYVPWYRVMDDMEDVHSAPGGTRGMTNVSREKKFKSGEVDRDIDDIVDNMIHNVLMLTRNSMRNYAANRIVMEYGTRNENGKIKVFKSEGADRDGVRFNIVAAGKRIVVQIKDPLVAEAVIGMENIDIPMFNALAYLANGLRRSITTFPAFQIAQLFMDAPTAALVTGLKNPGKVWATVFTSFLKNLRKDDPIVAKLRSYGIGGYQSSARTPEKEIQMDIGLIQGSWFSKAMKGLDRFGDASDYAQRRAVYMQTLKETGDELLAIFQANNVIDFQKRGSGGLAQAVTRSVAFMNAYAQSIDVLAKGLAGGGIKGLSRRQAIARMAATGMALSAATLVYCMLVGDDDEYNKLDDQTKMRNIYIPGLNMRLPMHTGASFFFKAIPELIYNAVMKEGTKDEYDAARLKRALGKSALDSLLGPNITPTGVKPVVEIILNKNFFTGGQVTPKGMEDLAAFRQYNQNTSELGKVISSLTGTEKTRLLNPMEADHLVRGLLGTIGAAAMWGTNILSSNRPEPQAKDNPLYGQFIMPDVARGREDLYYDLKEKTDEAYKTHQDLLKKGRKEEAAEWFKENKDLIKIYGYTSSIETNLKELNGEIRRLSDLPEGKMDPKQKRERINELQDTKMRVLKDVISMRKRAGL